MSTCISSHGEFSNHETDDEFTCRLCGSFDEMGALDEIRLLRQRIAIALEVTYWDRPYDTRIDAIRNELHGAPTEESA